jgi:acetyltransferase
MVKELDAIMRPKAIAVVGASTKPNTIGSEVMLRLKEYKFKGDIYPINPKADEICGFKVYKSVLDVPGKVDMALIIVRNDFVLSVIDECAEKGIKGVVVITAGFKETGKEGAELEKQLVEKLKQYGIRAIGPNCLGVLNTDPEISMDACFAEELPVRGKIGFVSQSGALGGGILNILRDLNIGFSQFISIGNMADIKAEDILEYWENEDDIEKALIEASENKNGPTVIEFIIEREANVLPIVPGGNPLNEMIMDY